MHISNKHSFVTKEITFLAITTTVVIAILYFNISVVEKCGISTKLSTRNFTKLGRVISLNVHAVQYTT